MLQQTFLYLSPHVPKSLFRVCDWKWNCWVIGHACLLLYKILWNCFPKCHINLHQGVRSPTWYEIICWSTYLLWCMVLVPHTDLIGLYIPGPAAMWSPSWRIARGLDSLPSLHDPRPPFILVVLNWVQSVGRKDGYKRKKPQSPSPLAMVLLSSRAKKDTGRGRGERKEEGKDPRKKRMGNIRLKASPQDRCARGWELNSPLTAHEKDITNPHIMPY